jgi:hypothetical protein
MPRVHAHTVDQSAAFILLRLFSPFGGGRVGALFEAEPLVGKSRI